MSERDEMRRIFGSHPPLRTGLVKNTTEPREMTALEAKAVAELQKLAKKWPQTLRLFSWSGSLCVMDRAVPPGNNAVLANIRGIPNDGGDPDDRG